MTAALATVACLAAALAVLVLPGAALLAVLGVRDGRLLTAAPAVTCVPLMMATGILHVLGIPWRPLSATLAMGALVGLAALVLVPVRRCGQGEREILGVPVLERRDAEPVRDPRLALAAPLMLVSSLVVAIPVLHGMGGLSTLNGSFDAFFHYSALRAVRDGGDAFPLTALAPMYGGHASFYPTAWHALTSLLPGDVIVASNAMAIAMLALLPVTVYGVTSRCVLDGGGPWGGVLAATVALATTLLMSPAALSLVSGLWPFALGVLTLPIGVAALLGSSAWAVRALALAGTVLAHPSTAFSLLVVVGAVCAVQVVRSALVRHDRKRALAWAAPLAVLLGVFLVVVPLRFGEMQLTAPDASTLWSTLVVALLDRPRIRAIPLSPRVMAPLLVLAVIGLAASLRRGRWIGLAALLIGSAGLILTFSAQSHDLSWFGRLSSVWYGARERIQPLILLGTVMAATLGATALTSLPAAGPWAGRLRRPERWRAGIALVVAGALVASVVVSAQGPRRLQRVASLAYTAYGLQFLPYATPAEVAFIRESGAALPPGSVVLGSPLDGTSLYYALDGVGVVYPSMASAQSLEQRRIGRYADELAQPGSLACVALREEGVTHVYRDTSEFSGFALFPDRSEEDFAGIASIPQDHLTEIARDGDHVLYRLDVPC